MKLNVKDKTAKDWGQALGFTQREFLELAYTGSLIFLRSYRDNRNSVEVMAQLFEAANNIEEFVVLQKGSLSMDSSFAGVLSIGIPKEAVARSVDSLIKTYENKLREVINA